MWFRVCSVSICVSVSLSGLMGIGSFLSLGPRGRSQVTLSACEDFLRKAVQKVLGRGACLHSKPIKKFLHCCLAPLGHFAHFYSSAWYSGIHCDFVTSPVAAAEGP